MSAGEFRTLSFTYQAEDADAEVFAVVMGSVAENFAGVTLHEACDETTIGDGEDRGAVEALRELLEEAGRLSELQTQQLERFGDELREWAEEGA